MRRLGAENDRAVRSQNFRTECWIFGTVLGNPMTDFGLLLVHICCLCVITNINNMLVMCKLCYYMRI